MRLYWRWKSLVASVLFLTFLILMSVSWHTLLKSSANEPFRWIRHHRQQPNQDAAPWSCDIKRPSRDSIKIHGGTWQLQEDGYQRIMTHSAFYDGRCLDHPVPTIRILAVWRHGVNNTLYCYIWYEGVANPDVTKATVTPSGGGHVIDGERIGQYLITCPLPASFPVPAHVSLATSVCGSSTIVLPVQIPYRGSKTHDFGICVPISFGAIPAVEVAEWIELHNMFGVGEFNIYNGSMVATPILQYYQDKGLLKLHQMPSPVSSNNITVNMIKLASPASLNHCMYSNMYRYKYLIVVDFDEVIVPRMHSNYDQMLEAVDTKRGITDPWSSYSFTNVFHFLDFGPDESQPSLRTLRYRTRIPASKEVAPKSFVDPRRCLSLFNHYCFVRPPGSRRKFTVVVDSSVASTNHYRWCKMRTCLEKFRQGFQDDHMLKYREELTDRVGRALEAIGESGLLKLGRNCQKIGMSGICL